MKSAMYISILARLLPSFFLGALLGVALSLLSIVDLFFLYFVWSGAFVFLVLRMRYFRSTVFAVFVSAFLLGLGVGVLRVGELPEEDIFINQKNTGVIGVVIREPDLREKYTGVTIKTDSHESYILVYAPKFPELSYGDRIAATGTLETPKDFETEETGRVFPYRKYLEKDSVGYVMKYPTVQKLSGGEGNAVVAVLFTIKRKFIESLARNIPEPESSLLSGLLLGGKQSLGTELLDMFRIAGIIHIVVLSGYNMTIVSQWIVTLAKPLGFYPSAFFGVVGIILFSIMAGAGATVVRAAIMAIIALLARVFGRTNIAGRALLLAGFTMVMHQPLILLYDPSFQLSFLATLGIIYGVPYLESHVKLMKKYPKTQEIIFSTIATQIFVLPFLLYQTGFLSLYALPANFLVLPLVPLAMFLGFWTGVAGIIIPPLALFFAIPTDIVLGVIVSASIVVAKLPFASFVIPKFSFWIVLVLYLGLSAIILSSRSSQGHLKSKEN